jgi:outer membrane receptor protein involved in Fe transport
LSSPGLNAQPVAPDREILAKYDTNHNGRLDPDEAAALQADEARRAKAPPEPAAPGARDEKVLELSPFQVVADTNGYYASNTLSGTRLNSKLEDLGASISIVTKQQMKDFAMLDINDIFLYEANTEGTGNYTDFTVDRNGNTADNVAGNPNGANRIRGIGAANTARGNFATSGRVPIDPINVDAVEISRGPNSSIFGLGNASGTVNLIPATANLVRESTTTEFRTDSLGGMRASLDLNRPIFSGKLALRASAVFQEERFQRKPSYSRTKRYNGMVTYRPFKNTTLRASVEFYENYDRRPNAILPRDGISYWQANGRPTWDPVTWTVTRNGVKTVVPFNSNQGTETTALGAGLESGGSGLYARPSLFIDQGGVIGLWMIGRQSGIPAPTTAVPNPIPTPDFQTGNIRFVESQPAPRAGPLAQSILSITDPAIYDWFDVNVAATNWSQNRDKNFTVELEQIFLKTPRHLLALQAGWFREDAKRYNRSFIGTGGDSPMLLYVDVNERLLDGRPNPYFLRPYINALEPTSNRQPFLRDTYRAQLAYQLTLSPEKGWLSWLGDHSFAAYGEYKNTVQANYRFRDAILDDHAWLPPGGNRAAGATVARSYYRYYLGDATGQNIEYGSPAWRNPGGTYSLNWYNAATGQWVAEKATLGEAYYNAANPQRNGNIIKTVGAVTQNHFFHDRIVTTFGWRQDKNYNRLAGSTSLAADGISPDYSTDRVWPNDWVFREGPTKTAGVVVKPFRDYAAIKRQAEQGSGITAYLAGVVNSLTLHYNRSDSFQPAAVAQTLQAVLLPDPTGQGKDYGFSLQLLPDNKLILRFNQYDNTQVKSRAGDSGIIATRAGRLDFAFAGNNDQFNLQRQATSWVTTANPTFTTQQVQAEVARQMGFPLDQLAKMNAYPIADVSDVNSKGKEIELNYNPTRFWTTKVAIGQQLSVDRNLSPNIQSYIDSRLPVWTTVIDQSDGQRWFTKRYGSAGTPSDFLTGSVLAPYKLAQANEGKPKSQIRQWRVNVSSSFQLAGITGNRWLKRMAVSGALRWEDKGSIGYYTLASDPNSYDPARPIYDKGHTYVDLGVNYVTKIHGDKIRLRVQLNVRNLTEGGRLQPIGALPNGVPFNYRIIDPRLFILSTTFDL